MTAERNANITLTVKTAGNAPQDLRGMATQLREIDQLAQRAGKSLGAIGGINTGAAGRPLAGASPGGGSALLPGLAGLTPAAMQGAVASLDTLTGRIERVTSAYAQAADQATRFAAASAATGPTAALAGPRTGPTPPGWFSRLGRGISSIFAAEGGEVTHSGLRRDGPRGSDTIPAWLTPGERVINAQSAGANRALLEQINAARGPLYREAGGPAAIYGRAFRRWFGDWAQRPGFLQRLFGRGGDSSRVVDRQGRPLRVYHGTSGEFAGNAWDPARAGVNDSLVGGSSLYGPGFYHTESAHIAGHEPDATGRSYAFLSDDPGARPQVQANYLNIRRPFDADQGVLGRLVKGRGLARFLSYGMMEDVFGSRAKVNQYLQKVGYDGITHMGGGTFGNEAHRVWIAFQAAQAKSALANRGTYDPNDPNMFHAGGGLIRQLHERSKQLYDFAEQRYGKKWAVASVLGGQAFGWGLLGAGAAMGVPLYVPGSTLAGMLPFMGAAELQHRLRKVLNPRLSHFAQGGAVGGDGAALGFPGRPRGSDTIPAWLKDGEYVVNAESAKANRGLVEAIDRAKGPLYRSGGGPVYREGGGPVGEPRYLAGGGAAEFALAMTPMGRAGMLGVGVLEGSARQAAQMINVLGDSSKTAAQKNQAFAESLPVIGGIIAAFRDLDRAMKGIPDELRRTAANFQVSQARLGVQGEFAGRVDTARFEATTSRQRATALGTFARAPAPAFPVQGLTLADQVRYERESAMYPLQENQRRAQQEAQIARQAHTAAQQQQAEIAARVRQAGEHAQAKGRTTARLRSLEGNLPDGARFTNPNIVGPENARNAQQAADAAARERNRIRGTPGPGMEQSIRERDPRGFWNNVWGGFLEGIDRHGAVHNPNTRVRTGVQRELARQDEAIQKTGAAPPAAPKRNEVGINNAITEQMRAQNQLQMERNRLEEALTRTKQTGIEAAQAESRARQAGIALAQQELQIRQQVLNRAMGAVQNIGAMRPLERREAQRVTQQFQRRVQTLGAERALDRAHPAQLERIQRFAPGYVEGIQRQVGERFVERTGMRQRLPEVFGEQSIQRQAQQVAQLQAQVTVNARLDEAKLAEEIAKHLGNFIRQLEANVRAQTGEAAERMKTGQSQRHAAENRS